MTWEEYKTICRILEKEIETQWVSMNYQRQFISVGGVLRIKDELKKMVKE